MRRHHSLRLGLTVDPLPTQPGASNDPGPAQNPEAGRGPRSISSTELFQNCREITIQHGEELYRLRLTKSGKLILHK
ncbi:hemin uptake protein HemP [Planctomicrobium sp. SH661]|uniref:hemin uptake protein HemP n=1 Tax=Planctomicrobium sp. SH661 TaxID=3448124 RepID=UPI003F5AEEFA